VTGVGIFLFLLIHVVDTAFIGWGPELHNKAMVLYRMPIFRIGEVFLAGSVLFHALNGVRTLVGDSISAGGWRVFSLASLYVLGFILLALGSLVILTFHPVTVP
jgi:succinate dehydrogenase / fumarate reductase cytochrome b subunit